MKLAIALRAMLAKAGGPDAISNAPQVEAVSFIGDKGEISFVEKNFKGIRSDPSAETLIICEGNTFPFGELIETIQKLPGAKRAMIHASGSHSIVGSWDKNKQGSVFVLTSL
jgi:hypothetical protein